MKLVSFLFIAMAFASCGKNEAFKKTKVTISFSEKKDISRLNQFGLSAPAALSAYNCFGVLVTEPENDGVFNCSNSDGTEIRTGTVLAGMVPITGSISLEINRGTARTFRVFGMKTLTTCPSIQSLVDRTFSLTNITAPAELGVTTVDLNDPEATVEITLDIANQKEFSACDGPGGFNANPVPFTLSYDKKFAYYTSNTAISPNTPTLSAGFTPDVFSMQGNGIANLKAETGLDFDTTTGIISGTTIATNTVGIRQYEVIASDTVNFDQARQRIYIVVAPGFHVVNSAGLGADNTDADNICETATAGECTLTAAIDEVNGGQAGGVKPIILPSTVGTITLTAQETLNIGASSTTDFVLMGEGADVSIISGGNTNGIFTVAATPDEDFYFAGIKFVKGNTAGSGGAYNNVFGVKTNIFASEFLSNTASGGNGGAIHMDGTGATELLVEESNFTNNTTSSASNKGGAISFKGASISLADNLFDQNAATGANTDAGALYIGESGPAATNVFLLGNNFQSNSSTQHAGALLIQDADAQVQTITNNSFKGNQNGQGPSHGGGAVYITSSASFSFANNIFSGNVATDGAHIAKAGAGNVLLVFNTFADGSIAGGGDGGAIFNAAGTMDMIGNLFSNNQENGSPGDCGGTNTPQGDGIGAGRVNMTNSNTADGCFANNDIINETNIKLRGTTNFFSFTNLVIIPDSDSAAVDAFPAPCPVVEDARHLNRPKDGPDTNTQALCDIGAIEVGDF